MRQKKLLAFIMAVILVITSVTISYKMSEAEEPTVSGVNIVLDLGTDSYNGKVFSVSFRLSSDAERDFTDSITVNENKITINDKTLFSAKTYDVTVTLTDADGIAYSGNTSITTPETEATGDALNVSGSVSVSAVTYPEVVITLDSAEYTNVSVVEEGYSITTPGTDGKCTITKTDSSAIEKGTNIHLKSSKDGIYYKKSLTIDSANINVSFNTSDEESYQGVTINLGDTYSNINITGEGISTSANNTTSVTLTSLINKGISISVSATKDGLNYTGTATVTAKTVDVTLTPTQYKLTVNNTTSSILQYSTDGTTYNQYDNNALEKDHTYNFKIVGGDYKVLTVGGVSDVAKSISDGSTWHEEATFSLSSDPGATITISDRKPKLEKVQIKNGNTSLEAIPAVTNRFEMEYVMENGYPVPADVSYNVVLDNDSHNISNTIFSVTQSSLTIDPDYEETDIQGLKFTFEPSSELGANTNIDNSDTVVSTIAVNIKTTPITYGENADYFISDDIIMYSNDGGKNIYYKDDSNKINVYNNTDPGHSYDKYKYSNGDFLDIVEGSNVPVTAESPVKLQMEKTSEGEVDDYGVGEVTLIKDATAPTIELQNASELTLISYGEGNYYSINKDDALIIKATDVGSGLQEKIFIFNEEQEIPSNSNDIKAFINNTSIVTEGGQANIASSIDEGEKQTLYIYAVDNVGNIGQYILYVSKDGKGPKVTATIDQSSYCADEDLYYLRKDNKNFKVDIYDELTGLGYTDPNTGDVKLATTLEDNSVSIELKNEDGVLLQKDKYLSNESFSNGMYSADIEMSDELEDGKYTLTIETMDICKNPTQHTMVIEVDTKDPQITDFKLDSFDIDGNNEIINPTNTGAYKFNFTEKNVKSIEISVNGEVRSITNNGEIGEDPYTYKNVNSALIDQDEYINGFASIIITDKAGNKAMHPFRYSFDKHSIVVTSVSNESEVKNTVDGKDIVNNQAKIKFEFTENNFREDLFKLVVVKSDSNEVVDNIGTFEVVNDGTSNDGKVTIMSTIDFPSDGKYKVKGCYDDIALYIGEKYSEDYESRPEIMEYELVSDNTTPVLNSAVTVDKTNKIMTVDYTLTETNPDFKNFKFTINAKNNLGDVDKAKINDSAVQIINIENVLNNESGWKKNNDGTYSTKIVFETEGEYSINITPKDYAAHTGSVNSVKEIFDITAPKTESLTVTTPYNTSNTDFSQFATGEKEKEAELTIKVSDLVSKDTVSVDYEMISQESSTPSTINKKLTLNRTDKDVFEGSVKINPNFKGILKFKYTDTNGNSTTEEIKYNNGIVVENAEQHALTSDVTISDLNTSDARKGIYNEDVRLNLATLATYSGINKVECTINGVAQNLNGAFDSGNITTSWNQDLSINSDTFEGNDIEVVFTMTDNAQFKKTTTATYAIDKTAPVIRVSYDNNSPLNERYYNATRTATISVDELNFENSDVDITATRNGSSMSIPANFSTDGVQRTNAAGKKYYTYVMNIPFAEDGDYTFTITVTDMAGNVTSYGQTDEFTIDKTNPEIQISYNNNNALNGNYYGEARVATITVNEHNFDPASVNVNITAQGAGVPAVSGFSNNGDVHTATVSFSEDADYTISANCVDLAGNESNSIAEEAFTVDLTDPVIEITGINSNESYKGSVNPVVTVTDKNYDLDGVEITIVGGKHGLKEVGSDIANIENGQTFTYSDLRHIQENDDSYTIKAVATDKAGHSSEEIMTYRVNRYGSIYSLNDELLKAVENYYATSSDGYAIIEENVDEVEKYTITYTVDNDIVNLEEGSDFTVKADKNKEDWNENVYTLSADSFEKEGVYNISISSEDSVGNVSDNKSKGLDVEFCIDNTKPVCIISGVAEGQEIKKDASADIVIEAYDNIKFADMKVEVNGEVLATEKDMEDGKVSFKLKPASGAQVLKVTCHDAAGNEELQVINFTFDVGVLKTHKTFVIVIIAVLALLAAGFIFFIIAKRRRDNQ